MIITILNKLTDNISIVPLALSDKLAFSTLNMTEKEWGGAMPTFEKDYGHDGLVMDSVFKFPTIGISMTEAVDLLNIPNPDHIKVDVDGIEHLILKGGSTVLKKAKSVLIEINDKFEEQASHANRYLKEAGFVLNEKRHAEYYDNSPTAARYTYNQIWIK